MTKLRLSIHSDEYIWLRELLLNRRNRRLDVFEFIEYCKGLDLDPIQILREIEEKFRV